MWPQTQPQAPAQAAQPAPAPTPYGAQPQYVAPPVPPQYAPQPAPQYVAPPTPYGAQPQFVPQPAPVQYTGTWPSEHYRHNIGHPHQNGGAVYGRYGRYPQRRTPYADDGPPGAGGPPGGGPEGPPPSDMGGSGDIIQQAAEGLVQIAQMLMQAAGGGGGGAPQGAFPPGGGGAGGPPTMASRYSPRMRQPRRYGAQTVPTPYGGGQQPGVQRTISGLPVGYQMEIDRLKAQNNQLTQAMQVVFYERDQADTQWCISEIRRLAAEGYDVGEYEVGELKNKPREHRDMYLQHIATRYAKVPGGALPPSMPGDPSPAHQQAQVGGPMTEAQMQEALRATANDPDPSAFTRAVNYMRSGGNLNGPAFGQGPNPAAFANPYEANGQGY